MPKVLIVLFFGLDGISLTSTKMFVMFLSSVLMVKSWLNIPIYFYICVHIVIYYWKMCRVKRSFLSLYLHSRLIPLNAAWGPLKVNLKGMYKSSTDDQWLFFHLFFLVTSSHFTLGNIVLVGICCLRVSWMKDKKWFLFIALPFSQNGRWESITRSILKEGISNE